MSEDRGGASPREVSAAGYDVKVFRAGSATERRWRGLDLQLLNGEGGCGCVPREVRIESFMCEGDAHSREHYFSK